jgi:hypothetical protein
MGPPIAMFMAGIQMSVIIKKFNFSAFAYLNKADKTFPFLILPTVSYSAVTAINYSGCDNSTPVRGASYERTALY